MKLYAAVGASEVSVEQVNFGCNQKLTLPAGQVGGIDFILNQGAGQVVLLIDKAPKVSTGSLVGIIVGSIVGVIAIGLGIYCCIKKKRANLSRQYEQLNNSAN